MSPTPIVPTGKHPYHPDCVCKQCFETYQDRIRARNAHRYGAPDDPLSPARGILIGLGLSLCILIALAGAAIIWAKTVQAREGAVHPIAAPEALLRARQACPNGSTLVECRGELRKAYAAVEWAKKERLELAREMVGKLDDWTCIHQHEGAWNANTGNGYHGGLQMDWSFMRTYGRDMLHRHAGRGAEAWTPREQIIVAQRAYAQGRGYAPWPATSRACGLR